ncbi:hypothetical protein AAVH_21907 [Aphelenchoides avenae]|nr:hypothetical protein AAVH_21907 [Aphelenchus avenae]
MENAVFIPDEVLVTVCEKLPRKDLERLQLVSTQFSNVIESSSALSARQGPVRVVTMLEFGAYFDGSPFSQATRVLLRDGTSVTCTDFKELAKRLKFATVQQLRWDASTRWFGSHLKSPAYIQGLSLLLPVKAAWKNATIKASVDCFPSSAAFEFVFTQLLFCREIVLSRKYNSFTSPLAFLRLPAVAAYNKVDVSGINLYGDLIPPADVVEWLEHEDPPGKKCSEPRQMILHDGGIDGGIEGLLTALKAAFSTSASPKPYVVRIRHLIHRAREREDA